MEPCHRSAKLEPGRTITFRLSTHPDLPNTRGNGFSVNFQDISTLQELFIGAEQQCYEVFVRDEGKTGYGT